MLSHATQCYNTMYTYFQMFNNTLRKFNIARLQDFKASRFQDLKTSELKGCSVALGIRMTCVQGYSVFAHWVHV